MKFGRHALGCGALLALVFAVLYGSGTLALAPSFARSQGLGARTVDEVLEVYGPRVERTLGARSEAAGVRWPPARTTWLAFKEERRLEVWVAGVSGPFVHLASYPVLAASGERGPKRQEGDKQVPEGFYGLTQLNPNSRYHLSVRVDYPNREDIPTTQVKPRPRARS